MSEETSKTLELAAVLIDQREHAKARDLLIEEAASSETSDKVPSYLALCNLELGNYEAYVEYAEKALSSRPNAVGTKLILGNDVPLAL